MAAAEDPRDAELTELRALVQDCNKLLLDIPFGVYNGRLVAHRSTTEDEKVEWVASCYTLRDRLQGR